MRTRTLVLSACGLLLTACGGGGHHDGSARALPGPSRLRFFNGSSQNGLGLAANGAALVATGASSADEGEGIAYESVADGTVDLSARTNGGTGTVFSTSSGAALTTGRDYTAFAYGASGSGGLVFASDSLIRQTGLSGYPVQVVDLLDGSATRYVAIYQNGQITIDITFQAPRATGFGLAQSNPGTDPSDRFTLALNADGTGKTPIGTPFVFSASEDHPTTVVVYGSPSRPRYAVLQGVYLN